jgi:predicted transcriptional regulator
LLSWLTGVATVFTLGFMEVNIGPDLQAKLARLASERGRDTQALVQEAIERFVDYDDWFLREVELGLAAADRGEFIDHEDIGKLIDRRYPG